MHSVIKIKVKILNQEEKSDKVICLGTFTFFQNESHDHGRGLMMSSLALLIMEKLNPRNNSEITKNNKVI